MNQMLQLWNDYAGRYDDEADHGLLDPRVRGAWFRRFAEWIPQPGLDILDLGCGTGSLMLLLGEQGHRLTGVDFAPAMVERAQAKLIEAGFDFPVSIGDASNPPIDSTQKFDVVLARHLLWALPDPEAALRHWLGFLRPEGRLVLIEGRWSSEQKALPEQPWAGGVDAATLAKALTPLVSSYEKIELSEPDLWGKPITDERFAVLAKR